MFSRPFDVIIVGAGPAGASAAILLASAGWSVALIEKQAYPRRKVCGECVAAPNLALLEALGIGAAFNGLAGAPLTHLSVMQGSRTVTTALPRSNDAAHPYGRALGREHLDTLLVERATEAGAIVFQPWSVRELAGAPGAYVCTIVCAAKEDQVLTAPVAIAAHGSWLPLPNERVARRSRRRPSDLFAFKANFVGGALAAGMLPVLSFAGGYGGMVRADGGIVTLACCVREDRIKQWRDAVAASSAGEAVQAVLKQSCEGVSDALCGATRAGPWLASGPLAPGIHLPRQGAPYFMIGNAAGEAHPIVGEGISMALQSAWLLCDLLVASRSELLGPSASAAARHKVHRRAIDRFGQIWRRHFELRIRVAALLAHVAMRPRLGLVLAPVLSRMPALLAFGARVSGKTHSAVSDAAIARLAPGHPRARASGASTD